MDGFLLDLTRVDVRFLLDGLKFFLSLFKSHLIEILLTSLVVVVQSGNRLEHLCASHFTICLLVGVGL